MFVVSWGFFVCVLVGMCVLIIMIFGSNICWGLIVLEKLGLNGYFVFLGLVGNSSIIFLVLIKD